MQWRAWLHPPPKPQFSRETSVLVGMALPPPPPGTLNLEARTLEPLRQALTHAAVQLYTRHSVANLKTRERPGAQMGSSPATTRGGVRGAALGGKTCGQKPPNAAGRGPQDHSWPRAIHTYISLGDDADYANFLGFRGLATLLPKFCQLSVPEAGVCGVYLESP